MMRMKVFMLIINFIMSFFPYNNTQHNREIFFFFFLTSFVHTFFKNILRWSGRFELNFKENTENTVVDPIFTTYLLLNTIALSPTQILCKKAFSALKSVSYTATQLFPLVQYLESYHLYRSRTLLGT